MIRDSALKAYRHCQNVEVYAGKLTCLKFPVEIPISIDPFRERAGYNKLAEDLGCLVCKYKNTPRPDTPEPIHIVPDNPPN